MSIKRIACGATLALFFMLQTSSLSFAHGGMEDMDSAEGEHAVTVDGRIVEGSAMISSDLVEVMLPLRSVGEMLGAEVRWDQAHQAALINSNFYPDTQKDTDMSMHSHAMNNMNALQASGHSMSHLGLVLNGAIYQPDLEPVMMNGIVFVSADTVEHAFDVKVKWNTDVNQVQVISKATEQFQKEQKQVEDVFHGIGLTPHIASDGTKEFKLTAELGPWSPVQGVVTTAWMYNGQAPGPVLRVTEGDHVRITLDNKLPEPTAIHWHGLHLPNEMDGIPGVTQDPVKPGESFTYEFTASHAGTFMYHTHYDDMKQLGNGLYGMLIIDPKPSANEIKYDHEYTMMLSGFHVNTSDEDDQDYYTINGRSYPFTPDMEVKKGETIRIRLANIDTMEVHTMHLHGIDFQVIAKDGHPVEKPQSMNTILIGPGETYDIALTADAVGTWMFHCHIMDHTMNAGQMIHGQMGGLITLLKVTE
ncbi:multicopper oxidase domain-containing protein [Paenibacillus hexagrammi]|uniref:Multicopper oxidase domain-containing protein n=1 Tax=Paenibacillus hexagrammi TaxID=2908839 RepID=A0ABY3SNJ7_9BACL|nr:multicopper oxidase domain-containing protein [Paenibacillus sp. YPD9-1]UJF35053.1 multicopper oxidase domain-containing protein [Paenibacillus sp. YPD9-1]